MRCYVSNIVRLIMVIMLILNINGQLKLTNPVVIVEPLKPFTFLVDGARISVANTVRLEQLDVLIGIDFTEARWKVTQSSLSAIINSFSQFGFFTDATLSNEFGGLCRIGEEGFARLGKLNRKHITNNSISK